MDLVTYLLVVFGITNIIANSTLLTPFIIKLHENPLLPLRYIAELLSCHMCMGFWIGGTLSYLVGPPYFFQVPEGAFNGTVFGFPVLDGFLASGFCWVIGATITTVGNIALAIKGAGEVIADAEPLLNDPYLGGGCGGCGGQVQQDMEQFPQPGEVNREEGY